MPDRISGVPLVCTYAAQRLGIYEFLTVHDDTAPTHVALTVALAEARERVIEAARAHASLSIARTLRDLQRALADLADLEAGS